MNEKMTAEEMRDRAYEQQDRWERRENTLLAQLDDLQRMNDHLRAAIGAVLASDELAQATSRIGPLGLALRNRLRDALAWKP